MKRLTLLAVALTMVLGMAATSFAAPEVTISGNVLVNAVWRDNWDFASGNDGVEKSSKEMNIRERADLYFTVTANENLKAVLGFRSVRGDWGQAGMLADSSGGTPSENTIGLRDAYIDFNWPGTSVNVKAGLMPIGLPAAVGGASMVHNARTTGVLVSSPITDNVSILAGFARAGDANDDASVSKTDDSVIDNWIVALPLNFEGFAMSPYFMYAPMGVNAGLAADAAVVGLTNRAYSGQTPSIYDADAIKSAWWLGTDFTMSMFDPFVLKADLNYGTVDGEKEIYDRSGWLFDIALDYTGFDFMNLSLTYAYTTGEDDDATNGSERLPVLINDWAIGSFWFGGGLITGDDLDSDSDNIGFHAVALSATGIQSFAEGLTHDAHIVYAKGTNDKKMTGKVYGATLTEEDAMWEVDFNTMYKIYDELTLYNGIGYINLDYDKDTWATGADSNGDGGDAWKFQLGMVYQF
ncbi:outer membrane homotrimeric porin [Pseudodesulfovibrio sp. JC047]|uniref:outer membrane homotrimeric porin n=1 Tax=Pseudodesulfovibrio sp. JC047 TaxID=2683199 RepID=UPI0013D1C98D|nr:outer membrane homotrimeric porin [Pseudodesulfovibrio sp. JC047]NDV19335.1 outer membrane homotrimeric porin [Pseudodesulfovibrio sp. JC047]